MGELSFPRKRTAVTIAAIGAALATAAVGGGSGGVSGRVLTPIDRHAPIAFVKANADALEGLQSAAGEQYDNRAYPRQYISPAQVKNARKSFLALSADTGSNGGKSGGGGTVTGGTATGPSTGTAGWTEVGPTNPVDDNPLLAYGGVPRNISGRALALLVGPGCTASACRLWVGTAGGGVWRTDNALGSPGTQNWQPVNAGLTSNAVSSLVMTADGTIYAGTGEPDGSNDSEAGTGLFKSTDGGDSWSLVGTSASVAADRSLAAVWVDPADSSHLLIGTAAARHGASAVWGGRAFPPGAPHLGVYESTDGGATWSGALLLQGDNAFLGGVTNLTSDPITGDVYAGVVGYGLYRHAAGTSSTTWTRVFTSASLNQPGAGIGGGRVEVALASNGDGTTTAYLGDSDTVGDSWVYKTSDVAHVTPSTWTQLSSKDPSKPGFAVYGYCETQCGYDDFIVVNPHNANEVYVGGSVHYGELGPDYAGQPSPSSGRAVVRSTDGGASWTDMTQDATKVDGNYTAIHPDQHALALIPGGGFFEVSDGGLMRASADMSDRSGECATRGLTATQLAQCSVWMSAVPTHLYPLNNGLATVQFQSLSTDANGDLLGGTQDNGTFSYTAADGPTSWFETIFGDGGQSGFDPADSSIRYHNYYDATPDVNFHGSQVAGWDWIGDPLQKETPSFYVPFIADPSRAGYAWVGLEHVWRTTDNGGPQAYLDAHCNEFNYHPVNRPCGDWQAIGGGGSGGAQATGSAGDAGDLTGTYFGQSRKGQFVTQVTRANNPSTIWAATRTGRVFISSNADAPLAQNVRWTRIDNANTPGRFVSGIVVDPSDPNHAWVSYSGYSEYAAGGHVYEVRFDPATGTANWTDLSYDLGDIPITSIVRGPSGDLYAGTDFGVAHLSPNAGSWNKETDLPIVSVFSLLLSHDGRTVYAATHGRGAWSLAI